MGRDIAVLVTGGSGFIGTSLLDALSGHPLPGFEPAKADPSSVGAMPDYPKFRVVGIDRAEPREKWQRQLVDPCDLLDYKELEAKLRWHRPDAVVHIAAQARVEPSVVDPLGTYDLNVQASLNVMKAAKATGVKHLILTSSEAVYGKARIYPSPENNDFAPINPYAASKIAVDVMGQQFDRVLPTCVVRSGMGWGPRSNPSEQVIGKFITKALRDEPLKFPTGNVTHPTRDVNFVGDFCRGVTTVLAKRARGVYNLSGGREYTVLDIAKHVINAVGKGRIEYDDKYQYRPGEEGFRTYLDVSKAERELGHKPQHHLVGEDGKPSKALLATVKWYKDNPEYWS